MFIPYILKKRLHVSTNPSIQNKGHSVTKEQTNIIKNFKDTTSAS